MSTCVIFNPAARGEKAKRFADQLATLSTRVTLKPTYAAGAGRALAAEAVREGFETIVAAGGDGTLNEVLNGIADEPDGLARTRLGVLPLGTINVFARELRLPTLFEPAWKIIEQGRESLIDLPQAEFAGETQPQRRCFAQLAGAGLDSRAIELVKWEQKKAIGPLAYVVAGFKALAGPKSQILASAAQARASGELVLIGNGRFYGGSFELFPKADPRDGLLDVTVFPKVNWQVLVRTGWGWLTDQLHSAAGCHTFQADAFTLSSSGQVTFELDGENVGHLPASFAVRRQALRVLTP
ncbi:MAG TPA: diacylglycerol kinase family protein [Candidatus Binatia bacterium]|nr:diacylglycerol kinase family protein [Candidatus Binatia bacterium]